MDGGTCWFFEPVAACFYCPAAHEKATNDNLACPKSSSRQAVLILAVVAVTLAFLGLALWLCLIAPEAIPLAWDDLTAVEINLYVFGYLFQSVVVPALLIYLLSATPLSPRRQRRGPGGRHASRGPGPGTDLR